MGVHVGIDLGSQPQVTGVELAHDPKCVIGEGGAYLGVRKTGFPAGWQPKELAAVQAVERVYHVDGFQPVLHGQRHLVADVGALLGFAFHTVGKIFPGDGVLEQDEIGVFTHVLEML